MSRTICKTYISDHKPLCQSSENLVIQSFLEIVLKDSLYYIYNCTYNSALYLSSLSSEQILALRQRTDLMFQNFSFDFDTIFKPTVDVSWEFCNSVKDEEEHEDVHEEELEQEYDEDEDRDQEAVEDSDCVFDLRKTPPVLHLIYTCRSTHDVKFISPETSETVETTSTVYIESYHGVFDYWKHGHLGDPAKHISSGGAIQFKCEVRVSSGGNYYIGGPDTFFPVKYQNIILIEIKSTTEEYSFTIVPGLVNNLKPHIIDEAGHDMSFTVTYEGEPIYFCLPITG